MVKFDLPSLLPEVAITTALPERTPRKAPAAKRSGIELPDYDK
jgi:hypothetical protein